MEDFFYEDRFCSDISDLMDIFDFEEENLETIPAEWKVSVRGTNLERVFNIDKDFVEEAIEVHSDQYNERLPEEPWEMYSKIKKAVSDCVDFEKLNKIMPKMYYPADKEFEIAKQDIIDFCKTHVQ